MADNRNLADLHPRVRVMAEELIKCCADAGIPLIVTSTLRSIEVQAALYAQGRTSRGPIVTNARPGHSFHNFGLAFDVVPTRLLGLPNWGDTPQYQSLANSLWAQVGAIGKTVGLRWGGDFAKLRDRPHFEWSGGLTLQQLREGKVPPTR